MSDIVRNVPIQARSQKRLDDIRNAARRVIAKHGRDRFTTGQVAAEANASIGTVYRYFPDRVAILDDLYPGREMVLREPGEEAPNGEALEKAAKEAYAVLTDTALQNPRDRVRQARAVLAAVLGIEE